MAMIAMSKARNAYFEIHGRLHQLQVKKLELEVAGLERGLKSNIANDKSLEARLVSIERWIANREGEHQVAQENVDLNQPERGSLELHSHTDNEIPTYNENIADPESIESAHSEPMFSRRRQDGHTEHGGTSYISTSRPDSGWELFSGLITWSIALGAGISSGYLSYYHFVEELYIITLFGFSVGLFLVPFSIFRLKDIFSEIKIRHL